MRFIAFILVLLLYSNCYAQKGNAMSEQMDYEAASGHQLLQMHNGNTLLFSFDAPREITVTVFGKDHQITVIQHINTGNLNFGNIKPPILRALFELNGEAVLFAERTSEPVHQLYRLRFSAETGLLKEDTLAIAPDAIPNTGYRVLKNKAGKGYSIFCCRDLLSNSGSKMELCRFNAIHEKTSVIPLDIPTESIRTMQLLSINNADDDALFLTIGLNGSAVPVSIGNEEGIMYERKLLIAEIGRDERRFTVTLTRLAAGSFPQYNDGYPFIADFGCDTNSGKFSYLMMDTRLPGNIIFYPMLLTVQRATMHLTLKNISDGIIVKKKNARRSYYGIPIKLYCFGDTTMVISENFLENKLGEIRITYLDSDAKVLGTSKMRRAQKIKNVYPDDVINNRETKSTFRYSAADLYTTNCIMDKDNVYVFYNENIRASLYRSKISKKGQNLNTYCLKAGRDMSQRRTAPFGKPGFLVYYSAFMGVADYQQENKSYATLIMERSWYKNFYRVAWTHLK